MRKGFTLIELLVSIALFGIIIFITFETIDNLRSQFTFFKKQEFNLIEKKQILSVLQNDFERAQSFEIRNSVEKSFDSISITGYNRSLYGIYKPYILWLVMKQDNTLIRLESAMPITLPIQNELIYQIHSDVIGKNCETFKLYESSTKRMVYLKFLNQPPYLLETTK